MLHQRTYPKADPYSKTNIGREVRQQHSAGDAEQHRNPADDDLQYRETLQRFGMVGHRYHNQSKCPQEMFLKAESFDDMTSF